ncbi:hypothetical protein REC12_11345 [Desulfosporosinus sp. PR]|uniref:hypothetical protein n=1 Tax=Candidatus Desulfosporosinus nitrosoreducens TaxID=3401928 RepID=UPI0027ED69AD|nr:hypothetical protein [Desulfosporosinus sp. PR]MDQ7094184.1 hypothetical protein [Desulfosporosinus sp. PR]
MSFTYYITPQQYAEANKNGVSPKTLEQRVRGRAWPIEKAIATPPRIRKSFGKWTKIANENGIKSGTFRRRVNVYGWDLERAATQPLFDASKHMKKVSEGNRVYPKHVIELAEKNGISYSTFLSRTSRGWSVEEASTRRIMTFTKSGQVGKNASYWSKDKEITKAAKCS